MIVILILLIFCAFPVVGTAQKPSASLYKVISYQFPSDVEEYLSRRIPAYKEDCKVSLFLSSQTDSTWSLIIDTSSGRYGLNTSNRKVLINDEYYDVFFDYDESFLNTRSDTTGDFGHRDGTIGRIYVIRESPFIVFSRKGIIEEVSNLSHLGKRQRGRCFRKNKRGMKTTVSRDSVAVCDSIVYYFYDEVEQRLFKEINALKDETDSLSENRIAIVMSHNGRQYSAVAVRLNNIEKGSSNRYVLIGDAQYEAFFDYDDLFSLLSTKKVDFRDSLLKTMQE